MTDIMKLCATCRHKHPYGIVGYSPDNVPLYGARAISYPTDDPNFTAVCRADQFIEVHGGLENAIALTQEDTEALWAKTSFLGAQVPTATRIAVAQLETLEGKERDKAFMSLMISQVTDIRGAMTKDESKFAHLVSHTDEIVESMRGVTQLKERLDRVYARLDGIEETLSKLVDHLMPPPDPAQAVVEEAFKEIKSLKGRPPEEVKKAKEGWFAKIAAIRNGGKLKDEAVVTDAEPATDK